MYTIKEHHQIVKYWVNYIRLICVHKNYKYLLCCTCLKMPKSIYTVVACFVPYNNEVTILCTYANSQVVTLYFLSNREWEYQFMLHFM